MHKCLYNKHKLYYNVIRVNVKYKTMKNHIDTLLKQEMTRKEFLQYIGGALLMAFGVTNLLKNILQTKPMQTMQSSPLDYGGSAYGGIKKQSS